MNKALYLTGMALLVAGSSTASVHTWTGSSSDDWNNAGNWAESLTPVNGSDAEVIFDSTTNLDTYIRVSTSIASLEFANSGVTAIGLKAANGADRDLTFVSTVGDAALVVDASATGDKIIGANIAGSLTNGEVVVNDTLGILNRGAGDLIIAAEIRGTGYIGVAGNADTIFSSELNTHAGQVNVANGAKLTIADGALWNLDINGNGVGSQITGNGNLTLNGGLSFNLAGASTTLGHSWQIVDVDSLNVTYGANFDCVSTSGYFTEVDGRWSIAENGIGYEFSEETGMMTVVPVGNWLSGAVGISWRFDSRTMSEIEGPGSWDVATLVANVKTVPGINYVLFNLSDAAFGDTYVAPHSVLDTHKNPDGSEFDFPLTPSRDLFLEMAQAFQAEGYRVITYIACQGPAMLKHGAALAANKELQPDGSYTSASMDAWETHVKSVYPNWQTQFANEQEMYKTAFAEIIVDEYAQRYGALIDGWWFDNGADAMNGPLLHQVATSHNTNIVCTFNGSSLNRDYSLGHPTPVAEASPSDLINQPKLLFPIERSEDGFLNQEDGALAVGHMYMPAHSTWNGGSLVWTTEQAADWVDRCTTAGGVWTWNLGASPAASTLRADALALVIDSQAERVAIASNIPPVFNDATIIGGELDINTAYSGSLSGTATDSDGDTLTYAKLSGPDWLEVATDGTLSGTPTDTIYVGMNRFQVAAADGKGNIDITELEIIVRNPATGDKAYAVVKFSTLEANLLDGRINGLRISDYRVDITKTTIGNDAFYAFSIENQNLDGDGVNQDSLSWRVRAKAYGPGSYTLNGNDSSASLGSNVAIGTDDSEFGTGDRYLQSGESVRFSVDNITLNTTSAVSNHFFDGFSSLWLTTGSYIFGSGTGLDSITSTSNGYHGITSPQILVVTSTTNNERLMHLSGNFEIYPTNNLPYFAKSNIALNSVQGSISSSLSALNGVAFDADNDTLIYSKVSGASWLSVASDGTLSGDSSAVTPGDYEFVIEVTDGSGAVDQIILTTTVEVNTNPEIRVTEYYLTSGDFTGLETTITLDQNLEDDYFILVRGSRAGDGTSFPDNNYARVSAVPTGAYEMQGAGGLNKIIISRHSADLDWEGVVTVVECVNSDVPSGFKLLDIVATTLTGASGTDTANAWNDVNQVVLFGGYRGGGASLNAAATSRDQGTSVYTRVSPSGTNTINWSRNAGGQTLLDATMTTFVIEWGSDWNVQHVNVSGSNGGNGANATGEYTTSAINSVDRSDSWVWGTGTRSDSGIGDSAEACLVTLGDGVTQNVNEATVAVGSEYTDAYDFDVYVMTHDDLAVDYRFVADGNAYVLDLPVTVDSATDGERFSWVYNGVDGTGTTHPRSLFWSRYTSDTEVTISRGNDSKSFPAWLQGIDFTGVNN